MANKRLLGSFREALTCGVWGKSQRAVFGNNEW